MGVLRDRKTSLSPAIAAHPAMARQGSRRAEPEELEFRSPLIDALTRRHRADQ